MKKLGHLGIYTLLVFLSIYLLDFSSLYLAKLFIGLKRKKCSIFLRKRARKNPDSFTL